MTTLTFIAVAVLGFCIGLGVAIMVGHMLIRKAEKRIAERRKAAEEALAGAEKAEKLSASREHDLQKTLYQEVKSRLSRAGEISREQAALMAKIDMPNKNSLHAKFKNGLVAEVKKLEEEKVALLQSILDDGFNPEIKVDIPERGGIQSMTLKEYFVYMGMPIATKEPETPKSEEVSPTVRKVGNFFVIKGGKDDVSN